jgi:hypothetical protein
LLKKVFFAIFPKSKMANFVVVDMFTIMAIRQSF